MNQMEREIINGVEVLLERAENYIQINDATEDDLSGVWPKLKEKFPRHTAAFCFRNVPIPSGFLNETNAELWDDCDELRLSVTDFEQHAEIGAITNKTDSIEITLITPENFEIFADVHDQANPDMSWPSRRIRERMDIWRVLACVNNGIVTDYILLMHQPIFPASEIFCVWTKDLAKAKALLTAAALNSFANGADEVLYMIDKDEEICKNAAMALGFKECGYYQGYKVIL